MKSAVARPGNASARRYAAGGTRGRRDRSRAPAPARPSARSSCPSSGSAGTGVTSLSSMVRVRGSAGGGGKLVCGAILLADLDVEGVVLGVLGVDVHAGERVAVRGATRVEQLRMVVATGVGAVIGGLRGVAHENARRLRLRRGRPEEQQAQDEDGGGGAAWTGWPTGPVSIPRPGAADASRVRAGVGCQVVCQVIHNVSRAGPFRPGHRGGWAAAAAPEPHGRAVGGDV